MNWPLRCRHWDTYRERRPLPGTTLRVWHFVCHHCGHAVPMMNRTLAEHVEHIRLVTQTAVTERTVPMTPDDPTPRPELEPDDPKPELGPDEPEDEPKPKPKPPAPIPRPKDGPAKRV